MGNVKQIPDQRSSAGRVDLNTIRMIVLASAVAVIIVTLCLVFALKHGQQERASSPKEVAQMFFHFLAEGNRDKINTMFVVPIEDPKVWETAKTLKGLKVKSLGDPSPDPEHQNRWLIPYEIQLTNGKQIKGVLKVKKGNPPKGLYVDGGI